MISVRIYAVMSQVAIEVTTSGGIDRLRGTEVQARLVGRTYFDFEKMQTRRDLAEALATVFKDIEGYAGETVIDLSQLYHADPVVRPRK